MSSQRQGAAAVVLCAAGGLGLAAAATAPWVRQEVQRSIGEAEVAETLATRGVELAPFALPLGVFAAAAGVALVMLGVRLRAVLGAGVLLAGIGAFADIARGAFSAAAREGSVTAAPSLAAACALAVVAAAVLALRAVRRPALPARYDIDADDADDEWRAAVDPSEEDE